MVGDHQPPPGGGGFPPIEERKSWASVLGSSLISKSDKNVLEVVLEKDVRGAFIVKEQDCANMMRRMGLDQRPGVHVDEVQICPQGRGIIFITLNKEVELGRFCRHDVLDVTETGIRSVMVKPAGKRDVVVTIKGIHPNTREDVVLDYLRKFGKVCSTKVVYGVFSEGPLKGIRNGDRSYKLEIKPSTNLGSYHAIDGQKVTLRYPGQQQTCGRCHQTPQNCPGRGVARKCEAEGGERVEFPAYILDLWKKIGYSPENFQLSDEANLDLDADPSLLQQTGGTFTPAKTGSPNTGKFNGVSIKQFPKDTDHGEVIEFIIQCGLPAGKADNVTINNRGTAVVRNLDNSECLVLIEAIHGKRHFDKKLYCNGIVPLTPEKIGDSGPGHIDPNVTEASGSPSPELAPKTSLLDIQATSSSEQSDSHVLPASIDLDHSKQPVNKESLPVNPHFESSKPEYFSSSSTANMFRDSFTYNRDLVKRHSLSIIDRSLPVNSLASEILASSTFGRLAGKSILSNIADIQETLSDFNSCVESLGESSSNSGDDEDFLNKKSLDTSMTVNDKKRQKKLKRKLTFTPGREDFLKKPNNKISPK